MNIDLHLHGKQIHSVFELLGKTENDITYSLGWALANCPDFRARVIKAVLPELQDLETQSVLLQERDADGITDIEIKGTGFHIIIEAKSGLAMPDLEQLQRYSSRLARSQLPGRALVTVSCANAAFASTCLPDQVNQIRCRHLSLADLGKLARERGGSHAEKRLLRELDIYLKGIAHMADLTSNMVYVVALSNDRPPDSQVSWREMVEVHGIYLHPVGGAYPREPVNYVGFRYGGQLQSIRHVKHCEVVNDITGRIPGCQMRLDCPNYLYTLDTPVIPSKPVRNGKLVMANRVYAAIDLLLTCDTISEAGELTRKRLGRD